MNIDFNPWYSATSVKTTPGIPITLTGIILISLCFCILVDMYNQRTSVWQWFPSLTLPLGLIVIWAGLSGIFAVHPAWAEYGLIRMMEALLIFVLGANLLKSHEDMNFIANCLALTIVLTGLLAIIQFSLGTSFNLQVLGGSESLLRERYGGETISRISGFFGHANSLANFLAGWLPVLLMTTLTLTGSGVKLFYFIPLALGSIALVMTFSRGGWIGFCFSLIIIAFFLFQRRRKIPNLRKLVGWTFLLLVVYSLVVFPFYSRIEKRLVRDEYDAAYARVPLARTALKIIMENPLKGVGLKNYQTAVTNYEANPPLNPYGDPEPVHNIYLETAAELGIPSLIILIYILLSFLKQSLIGTRAIDKQVMLYSIGLFGGLGAFYLHGMVDHGALGDPKFLSLCFMGGLATALSHFPEGHLPDRTRRAHT